jgi:hypothetical protein
VVRGLIAGLAAAALLVACTDDPEAGPVATPSGSPTPTVSSPTVSSPTVSSPPTTAAPARPPAPLTIAVAGDIHFEGVLRERLADPATALAPATRTLAAADLAIVNLETAVGEGGRPEPGKRFTFLAPASAFTALAEAGVDVATMANNHALDFGREMLASTFAAIDRAPLAVVGVGRDADEAFRPALSDVDGTVVATIGATTAGLDPTADPTGQWAATPTAPGTADAIDPARLLRAVADADRGADVVVVYLHWGVQGETCPSAQQRRLATRLVDRGADVVIGSHAHVVQGGAAVGEGYVAYGLGNYAWYQPSDTGVLTLTVQPPATPGGRAAVTDAAWEPARIGADGLPARSGPATSFPDAC